MKKIVSSVILVFISSFALAQGKLWIFENVEECYEKNIYCDIDQSINKNAYILLSHAADNSLIEQKKGKLKKVRYTVLDEPRFFFKCDITELSNYLQKQEYTIAGDTIIKKKTYLCFEQKQKDSTVVFFISKQFFEDSLLHSHIINPIAIGEMFEQYKEKYHYVNVNRLKYALNGVEHERHYQDSGILKDAEVIIDSNWKYNPVKWVEYEILTTKNPFKTKIMIGGDEVLEVPYNALTKLISNPVFYNKTYVDSLYQAKIVQDSLDDLKDNDHFICVELYSGDTVSLYLYDQDHLWGYSKGKMAEYAFSGTMPYRLDISEQEYCKVNHFDLQYLKRRGKNGSLKRKTKAFEYDSLSIVRRDSLALKKLDEKLDSLNRIVSYIDSLRTIAKRNQAFIISQDYAYGEYGQFGLEWMFYNCFGKSIKYIELTVKPYNQVGDIQHDDIGRRERKVKCIGPIPVGVEASFSFDDLFWDDLDIISLLRVTFVRITFMDNSVKTYSGYENIKKRMMSYVLQH